LPDGLQNPFQRFISQHVGGAKSHHPNPLLHKPGLTPLIVLRLRGTIMGESVDLDREARRRAIEIENVGSDRMLSAKAQTQQAPPQSLPEDNFRQGHFPAQCACTTQCSYRRSHAPLRLAPLATSPAVRGRIG